MCPRVSKTFCSHLKFSHCISIDPSATDTMLLRTQFAFCFLSFWISHHSQLLATFPPNLLFPSHHNRPYSPVQQLLRLQHMLCKESYTDFLLLCVIMVSIPSVTTFATGANPGQYPTGRGASHHQDSPTHLAATVKSASAMGPCATTTKPWTPCTDLAGDGYGSAMTQ